MIQHTFGLLVKPSAAWRAIADLPEKSLNMLILYPCIFAILPAVAWYYGTSVVGWAVGDGDAIKLTVESARTITILFYVGMVGCVAAIGYFIHWMANTYGADSSLAKGIVIAGLTATPLFIFGLVGFHPILWVDLLIGMAAVTWSVYLLYLGIPIVMGIPEERGFLFSSAVLAIGRHCGGPHAYNPISFFISLCKQTAAGHGGNNRHAQYLPHIPLLSTFNLTPAMVSRRVIQKAA